MNCTGIHSGSVLVMCEVHDYSLSKAVGRRGRGLTLSLTSPSARDVMNPRPNDQSRIIDTAADLGQIV